MSAFCPWEPIGAYWWVLKTHQQCESRCFALKSHQAVCHQFIDFCSLSPFNWIRPSHSHFRGDTSVILSPLCIQAELRWAHNMNSLTVWGVVSWKNGTERWEVVQASRQKAAGVSDAECWVAPSPHWLTVTLGRARCARHHTPTWSRVILAIDRAPARARSSALSVTVHNPPCTSRCLLHILLWLRLIILWSCCL